MMKQIKNLWQLFAQAVTIFAAAVIVAVVFLKINTQPFSHREAVSKVLPSVVSIYGRDEHGAQSSIGSGVIVSDNGYILTNYHLIANISKIEVGVKSGTSYVAELIGIDPDIDIAVLRINAESLPAIGAAEDSLLQPGDIVLAVGNPFGLNRTTTMGIVSAVGRDRLGLHGFEQFIQTDAAINPGSSGGALANAEGKLVGINSALFYRQHGITPQGIGFAIPAGLALNSYGRLINPDLSADNTLGVEVRELSPRLRSEVLITRVWRQSPAARHGLKVGDIILSINGANPDKYIAGGQLLLSARQLEILRNSEEFLLHLQ